MSHKQQPQITFHHLNDSRSQRILWLLEELEVPYELKKYDRGPKFRSPPELERLTPLGKAPVLTDGDITLSESGAIVVYLIKRYGSGRFDPTEAGEVDDIYFTHYAEGSLMPILTQSIIYAAISSMAPWFLRPLLKWIFRQVLKEMVDPELAKHKSLVSQPSVTVIPQSKGDFLNRISRSKASCGRQGVW
ncbi:hypothetical protein HYDPIDRAFT_91820 [Hydnomerulius pinastri MD-312]|uniref:glutathione transferase n=1 Tax=Hydnomerulius pinastri MD-312 TaxID=994086 RepID=A0A0C9W8F7_9AGAM|nr:hypothetical protein HYDPIDRAFT_91820 [Hydnomerulius pinastri MD-312]